MVLPNLRPGERRRRNAFTLLEVLVVMAILVILAGVASIYVFRYYEDSKKDTARLNARNIKKAVDTFALKNDGNPPNQLADVAQYMEGGAAALLDPWGKAYQFEYQDINGTMVAVVFTTAPDGEACTSRPGGK